MENKIEKLNSVEYLRLQYYLENGVDLEKLSMGLDLPLQDTVRLITEEYFFERYKNYLAN